MNPRTRRQGQNEEYLRLCIEKCLSDQNRGFLDGLTWLLRSPYMGISPSIRGSICPARWVRLTVLLAQPYLCVDKGNILKSSGPSFSP
ncbi:uncharacterized protein PHALS_05198 [Plasmopara halstedii]|uniref:Uncharacterized protein n=1 Tax=Plasmopara halstedii TaxID=4781 RepID=A0A0P1B2N5_PLAHL|nr:uncharacterized protein PHALS_05198 [Plasmopara halstedii]CEG47870.1 hypothetical protein PHALS_05198 [Plasmopara halstedii]|eukprot:XP_024584239.1 hypothetical protein PHALS_05198 [Plasmopara halstedii]